MFDVSLDNKIEITRGDSGTADLEINAGTIESPVLYEMSEGDEVHFYVYAKGTDYETDSFIDKVLTKSDVGSEGFVTVQFTPKDTNNIVPGVYNYRVKVIRADGRVDTVIEENTFIIKN